MDALEKLKRSLRNYLSNDSLERIGLKNILDELVQKLPEIVIFGGMLREFGLGNVESFTSDIDLVSFATRQEIYRAIAHFSPIVNKFGGFRFSAADRMFDLWSFEDTWAFREGLVTGKEFSDLLKTTFFNLDAVAFHVGRSQFIYSENYNKALCQRLLDLNLVENPSPSSMALRAIRMAYEKDLSITPRLACYILKNFSKNELDPISASFVTKLKNHSFSKSENFRFESEFCLS